MGMCPRCHGRSVGRVGVMQYYCWDCCVEFVEGAGGATVYVLDEDGELVPAPEFPAAEGGAG
jgi:ribosomal protein L37AE/L43A